MMCSKHITILVKENLSEENYFIILYKIHNGLVKYENHILSTLFSHLPSVNNNNLFSDNSLLHEACQTRSNRYRSYKFHFSKLLSWVDISQTMNVDCFSKKRIVNTTII
ncbi:unnamed protein product [Schistosoma rodhaini]|nr:unnamed protein product [Schistosoma rodhaini]